MGIKSIFGLISKKKLIKLIDNSIIDYTALYNESVYVHKDRLKHSKDFFTLLEDVNRLNNYIEAFKYIRQQITGKKLEELKWPRC